MTRQRQGTFLKVPYNWQRPTRQQLAKSVWDPDDNRILRPRVYGWGYGVNFAALSKRVSRR